MSTASEGEQIFKIFDTEPNAKTYIQGSLNENPAVELVLYRSENECEVFNGQPGLEQTDEQWFGSPHFVQSFRFSNRRIYGLIVAFLVLVGTYFLANYAPDYFWFFVLMGLVSFFILFQQFRLVYWNWNTPNVIELFPEGIRFSIEIATHRLKWSSIKTMRLDVDFGGNHFRNYLKIETHAGVTYFIPIDDLNKAPKEVYRIAETSWLNHKPAD